MSDNFWIGNNELVIVFRNGIHHVLERYEDYEPVFTGRYEKCREYCKSREADFLQESIG